MNVAFKSQEGIYTSQPPSIHLLHSSSPPHEPYAPTRSLLVKLYWILVLSHRGRYSIHFDAKSSRFVLGTIMEASFGITEDELVRELFGNQSPLFLLPEEKIEPETSSVNEQAISQLLTSTLYSGPTIQYIENALSTTSSRRDPFQLVSQARVSTLEGGLSKFENNKYTLKLKSCGSGLADDGYKWRKYGQKAIKNSPHPRSYYKCTNPRCSAKKQVERSIEDEDAFIITYEGLHLHFMHPYFLLDQPHQKDHQPPPKKPKRTISESESKSHESSGPPHDSLNDDHSASDTIIMGPQGLLEDVVPFRIRNPTGNIVASTSSSCSSHRSPPTSPSSLSWSPTQSYLWEWHAN
ncbi:hypothetical protein K2173_019435 [Erythroxylum novogranatense]|uniref:WRKY domain-containing protein n=1 Tax=Erythroxylum novogranatense TaxID=1862640 RepID=A0AAV8UBG7_9ROSI|nr:hypothetical protein K2173_019435 [Erythroxylum novogranatense]